GQAMVTTAGSGSSGVEVFGMQVEDIASMPSLTSGGDDFGDISRLGEGIALGSGIARDLGLQVGDRLRLVSPDGPKSPMGGSSLRVMAYELVYVFTSGSPEIDRTRAYLP